MSSAQGLDREKSFAETERCLKSYKAGSDEELVGKLYKYISIGMKNLLKALYEVVWTEEGIPKSWRQGLIV